jgi:holo-[acyl-carrier protein] synthase
MCRLIGIGTDIEEIERFRLTNKGHKTLLAKIFTEEELEYCFSKEPAAPHLAARYTGKEAIIKALNSISMGKNLELNEIEIYNNEIGVPMVHINKFNNLEIYLSLSHCKDKAIAFVIIVEKVK